MLESIMNIIKRKQVDLFYRKVVDIEDNARATLAAIDGAYRFAS
ncbi:MAG: hypothetical protein ACRD42_04190 [Nitrososphaeraceae archaeon]